MKSLMTLCICLAFSASIVSQTFGTISYIESIKLDMDAHEGMDMGDMLPDAFTTKKELLFNGNISLFREAPDNESDDHEFSSDDGSFKMVIKTSDSEHLFYTDLSSKAFTEQTDFMGKEFLVSGSIDKHKWRLTDEKIKYLGYVCQKAEMTEPGMEEGEPDRKVVAWFTSEIPVPIGPAHYNQLPGAILMINVDDGKTEFKATAVDLTEPSEDALIKPKNGKKVTAEEYEKIVAEKMAEMQKEHGGRGNKIIIRG